MKSKPLLVWKGRSLEPAHAPVSSLPTRLRPQLLPSAGLTPAFMLAIPLPCCTLLFSAITHRSAQVQPFDVDPQDLADL